MEAFAQLNIQFKDNMNQDIQNKLSTFFHAFLTEAKKRDSSTEIIVQHQFNPFEGDILIVTLNAESGIDKWQISVKNNVLFFVRVLG